MLKIPGNSYTIITELIPNTPAAKAGLITGELLYKIDGESISFISKMRKLHTMQERKWAELEAGKKSVSCSLEVGGPGGVRTRTITMVIPSPTPHWGSEKWSAPEGRMPAVVKEAGPLAALTQEVLDMEFGQCSRIHHFLKLRPATWRQFSATSGVLCSRQAHIAFGSRSSAGKPRSSCSIFHPEWIPGLFLTSPSGAMEKARCWPSKKEKGKEIPPEEVRAQFEAEMNFWLIRVGPVTGRAAVMMCFLICFSATLAASRI